MATTVDVFEEDDTNADNNSDNSEADKKSDDSFVNKEDNSDVNGNNMQKEVSVASVCLKKTTNIQDTSKMAEVDPWMDSVL